MKNGIIITALIVFIIFFVAWIISRARKILEFWAAENRYYIVSSEIRWLRRGPFFWTTTKNQVVYYVTIRTPEGILKKGWVRCGGWWWGVFTDGVEVRWEIR